MRRLGILLLRGALAACLAAIAVTGFYYAGAQYCTRPIGRLRQAASVRLRAHDAGKSRELEESVEHSLPGSWQADLKAGTLWVTHCNPDGTVADALPFESVASFYGWAEAHPDFCDLDVDVVAFGALRAAPISGGLD